MARAPSLPAWDDAEVTALRRLWREFLPVWAIAQDLRRPGRQVQAMVRHLDLAHRDPAAVAFAERRRVVAGLLRRARAAEEELFPEHMGARAAAKLAAAHDVRWRGRRDDIAELNAALNRAGRRPVHVPFRELRA